MRQSRQELMDQQREVVVEAEEVGEEVEGEEGLQCVGEAVGNSSAEGEAKQSHGPQRSSDE